MSAQPHSGKDHTVNDRIHRRYIEKEEIQKKRWESDWGDIVQEINRGNQEITQTYGGIRKELLPSSVIPGLCLPRVQVYPDEEVIATLDRKQKIVKGELPNVRYCEKRSCKKKYPHIHGVGGLLPRDMEKAILGQPAKSASQLDPTDAEIPDPDAPTLARASSVPPNLESFTPATQMRLLRSYGVRPAAMPFRGPSWKFREYGWRAPLEHYGVAEHGLKSLGRQNTS
eukprot:NODE_3527_length_916_cov_9.163783_g2934_i0.p1 GENE.NODE_3527_length_916_cov_9.163783_g2934_i0~~NODE_3527_length_916_cov_9.163783_g2934_i0.p1  ORF type:complete len:227 (+),score=16.36 NODE_3527_length_916_cov_9.163783_g2934_i0:198-878(+)